MWTNDLKADSSCFQIEEGYIFAKDHKESEGKHKVLLRAGSLLTGKQVAGIWPAISQTKWH